MNDEKLISDVVKGTVDHPINHSDISIESYTDVNIQNNSPKYTDSIEQREQ
jgi:hypothetical protein